MFENIGEKLKVLAKIIFAFIVFLSLIIGFYIIFHMDNVVIGLSILLGGVASSIVTGYVLYGFGELVNNSFILADQYIDKTIESSPSGVSNTEADVSPQIIETKKMDFTHCQKCNNAFNSNTYIHYNQRTGEIVCHDCFSSIKNKDGFKLLLGIPSDKK